jgi:hypothetical protein
MADQFDPIGTAHYAVAEVVGIFQTAAALETAVAELETAGFGRASISILATKAERSGGIDALYKSANMIADDPAASQAVFVSPESRTEGEAAEIAVPIAIGGFAGAWIIAAAGGALIAAIGATIVGGVIGAGLGSILILTVARHHAAAIQDQLGHGGLVLWVKTPDPAAEQRVSEIMRRCGGMSVHAHTVTREWGTVDSPLHDVQPDPFLVRESR